MNYQQRIQTVLNGLIKASDKDRGLRFRCKAERHLQTCYESAWGIPAGYSILNVRRSIRQLVAICGGPVELTDKGGVVEVRVITEELPEVIPFSTDILTHGKVLLGYDRLREPVYHTWKNPHLLIAAETGWGKTEAIRSMIFQLCRNHTPDELEVHIIDLKGGVSFLPFHNVPHITMIAHDLETAYTVMQDAYNTMRERAEEVREFGSRRAFRWYRQRIVVIDEAAQISPALIRDKDLRKLALQIDNWMASIACVGREIGFNLIYCTQYPHSDVINSQVKINCGGRLCFHVPQAVNSFVVLDQGGAEELTVKGRAILKTDKIQTIQVPYLLPEEGQYDNDTAWESLLQPLKTEVIYEGRSERSDLRCVQDATFTEQPSSGPDLQGPWEPRETRFSGTQGAGEREAGREQTARRHVPRLALNPSREAYVGDTSEIDIDVFE